MAVSTLKRSKVEQVREVRALLNEVSYSLTKSGDKRISVGFDTLSGFGTCIRIAKIHSVGLELTVPLFKEFLHLAVLVDDYFSGTVDSDISSLHSVELNERYSVEFTEFQNFRCICVVSNYGGSKSICLTFMRSTWCNLLRILPMIQELINIFVQIEDSVRRLVTDYVEMLQNRLCEEEDILKCLASVPASADIPLRVKLELMYYFRDTLVQESVTEKL
jgi:hypothetical protein